jgi:amidase
VKRAGGVEPEAGSKKQEVARNHLSLSSYNQYMIRAMLSALLPVCALAADLTGTWNLHLIRFGEEMNAARVELKSDGAKLTGTLNELKLVGETQGDQVHITLTRPNGSEWGKLDGKVEGDRLSGTVHQGSDEFGWNARRAAAAPAAPRTHTFEPTVFHRQFSGSITPALRIHPGDTVKTTTVDAGGRDAKGVRRSMGGNPETGPFYVEGAMPGDTLAIKFNRIRLNRDSAGSGDMIVPSALDPSYFRDAKLDRKFDSEWKLDREGGFATPAKPTDRMKNFRVKLSPMLGCVGVAPPANQSYRSGWLGNWGGNMDYNGLREGVTVYLPVFQEGAILFVGDGHALEGDGELTGDALETSMDVEFTVNLIRGQRIRGPRFESDEYVMASGIGGSLPDALQEATTSLAEWLEHDYKLNANEAALVLGTSIRYDIAEVVDPQVHIVAKVAKSVVAQLK